VVGGLGPFTNGLKKNSWKGARKGITREKISGKGAQEDPSRLKGGKQKAKKTLH